VEACKETKVSLNAVVCYDFSNSSLQAKTLYLALAHIYEKDENFKGASQLLEKALKSAQHRKSKKIWIAFHKYKILARDAVGAKDQLTRSLQALALHKHVEVISRFALAEFEHGSVDNGRLLFEELLSSYPKRSDLWFLFIDKEIKGGNIAAARHLFERMVSVQSSSKIMKAIFKKFLAFETQYGTVATQEHVKESARKFVEKISS
jgi:rRNA biogenesis protein RRP5